MNVYEVYNKKELQQVLQADYFYIDDEVSNIAYFYNYVDDLSSDAERNVELVHTVPQGGKYIIKKLRSID